MAAGGASRAELRGTGPDRAREKKTPCSSCKRVRKDPAACTGVQNTITWCWCAALALRRPAHYVHRHGIRRPAAGGLWRPRLGPLAACRGTGHNRLCQCAAARLCGRGPGTRAPCTCAGRRSWVADRAARSGICIVVVFKEQTRTGRCQRQDEDCMALRGTGTAANSEPAERSCARYVTIWKPSKQVRLHSPR